MLWIDSSVAFLVVGEWHMLDLDDSPNTLIGCWQPACQLRYGAVVLSC